MRALRSDPPVHLLALRVTLAFAAALTVAEGYDLEFSFVAALVAATLAMAPSVSLISIGILPAVAWLLATGSVIVVEALATALPAGFLIATVAIFWMGFSLSARPNKLNVIGLMMLVVGCVVPLRLLSYADAAGVVVDDLVWNVLVGVSVTWAVGLVLAGPPEPTVPVLRSQVLPPLVAAVVLTVGAALVWVVEPPAPGAVLVGMLLTLRPDVDPGRTVARDRVVGALIGGGLAVVAATLIGLSPVLPTVFLSLMVLAWPLALYAVQPGEWRGAAIKSLYALAILTGEGFSALFENTETRFGIRVAGVLIGLAFAMTAITLLQRRPVQAEPHQVDA